MNHSKAYNIYNNMLVEYPNIDLTKKCSSEQNSMFLFLVKAFAELHEENPIKKDEPGYNEYEDLIYFYDIWPRTNNDCAFIRRFVYAASELCRLRQDNIFTEKDNANNQVKEQNKMNQNKGQYKTFGNTKKVFGVVPEDKQKKDEIKNDLQ